MCGSDAALRVLVVEREQFPRETIAAAIEASDPSITCVSTADVESSELHIADAVLLSVRTPGVDVRRSVFRLAQRFERVVVVVTYPDLALVEAATRAGAETVLGTAGSLPDCVAALWGRPAPLDEQPGTERVDHYARQRAQEVGLTRRQHEVLRLIAEGLTPNLISRELGIQLNTARDHIKGLRAALDVSSVPELIVVAARLGLLPELQRPMR